MEFPRQEYQSGLPFPSPGDFPTQGPSLHFLHWQADSLTLSHQGSPFTILSTIYEVPSSAYFHRWSHSVSYHAYQSPSLSTLFLKTFRSVQSLSHVQLFATPWTAAHQASLSITNSRSPPKPMSIESVIPSYHLILCHPLLLPPIFPSIRVFSNESALCIRWPKYWSFSLSISPSNEHPGLISFRMDWLDLLAVQGTLKSLLQHHSSKASIVLHSAFFIVQLSHSYMKTLTHNKDHLKIRFSLFF